MVWLGIWLRGLAAFEFARQGLFERVFLMLGSKG